MVTDDQYKRLHVWKIVVAKHVKKLSCSNGLVKLLLFLYERFTVLPVFLWTTFFTFRPYVDAEVLLRQAMMETSGR